MDDVKAFVTDRLTQAGGIKPDSVTCPSSVKTDKGTIFACKASFGKAVATVTMRLTSEDGDVEIEAMTGVVVAEKMEAMIVDMMEEQVHTHVKASCGDRIQPAIAGGMLECEAKDEAGATYNFEIDIEDTKGAANVRLVSGPGVIPALPDPPK